jgi:hypothetical protein
VIVASGRTMTVTALLLGAAQPFELSITRTR